MDKPPSFFDPFGLFEKLAPPPWPPLLFRAGAIALLVVFLVHRLGAYRAYVFKPLWAAETLIYVVFAVAYAVRTEPVGRSKGFKEIVVPLVGALLPFALLAAPPSPLIAASDFRLRCLFGFMTATTAFTLWGLWSLRRSFSITVEARGLVTGGPYRWVRHPVYLGETLTAAGVALWRLTPGTIVLFVLFAAVQILRAKWEETKLTAATPGYGAYAQRTWWLWRR